LNWLLVDSPERGAQYFIAAYNSKSPTTKSVKAYLDGRSFDVPSEWAQVVNDVASKGIPEATFPWDVANTFGSVLEKMELYATTKTFNSAYDEAIASAKQTLATIMSRTSYTQNPKYKGE
jgi:hypothetical protein